MKPKVTPEMKLGMREFENTMFMLKAIPCEQLIAQRLLTFGAKIKKRLKSAERYAGKNQAMLSNRSGLRLP